MTCTVQTHSMQAHSAKLGKKMELERIGCRTTGIRILAAAMLWTALLCAPTAMLAQQRTQGGGQAARGAEAYFTNVELVNQHGETMRLYRDLLQDKVVVIDTLFTECTGICPVMGKTLQKIQEHVGDRLGQDVHLISISVDPETDTPEKLEAYAEKFKAEPGWYFLTGTKENVDFALKKLGGYVEDREAHNAIFIIGNEPTGLWKKAMGLAPAKDILPIVDSVLQDRLQSSGQGSTATP